MDILKRELAPITEGAWNLIEAEARRTLQADLSARKLVEVDAPRGFDFAAVNLGRLTVPKKQPDDGVRVGVRQVQPLVEARAQFRLDLWELDNAERGAADVDLRAVSTAARALARFEEQAVYRGFGPGSIKGLAEASSHEPVRLGGDPQSYLEAVARGILTLRNANVGGPFALALGPEPYRLVEGECSSYPLIKRLAAVLQGPVVYAPFIDGGFLLSTRGGDFQLVLGQDMSVGYEAHDTRTARLYLGESFTFRVLEPAAVVPLAFDAP
jgi:uncharacterized linocin/CFP29 family protein